MVVNVSSLKRPFDMRSASRMREEAVAYAVQCLGLSAPDYMWLDMGLEIPRPWCPGEKRMHWCAIFAAWILKQSLPGASEWKWTIGNGLDQFGLPILIKSRIPRPADVAVFGPPSWHHDMVAAVKADGNNGTIIEVVGGNRGRAPGRVEEGRHRFGRSKVSYYDVSSLCVWPD
jgi:hypothetical protein